MFITRKKTIAQPDGGEECRIFTMYLVNYARAIYYGYM